MYYINLTKLIRLIHVCIARESDSKETNPSLYKLSAKIKNDQDSICNVSVANQSVNSKIKENLLKDKESVSKSDQSFCISKRGRVLDSTSDWQTIEDEMSSHGGTKVVAKEKEPFGNLKDRVYVRTSNSLIHSF